MGLYFGKNSSILVKAIKSRRPGVNVRIGNKSDFLIYDNEPPDAYFDGINYEIVLRKICMPDSGKVVLLSHEFGHLENFHREFNGNYDKMMSTNYYYLERKAYLYGWALLKKFLPKIKISKEDWRLHHCSVLDYMKNMKDSIGSDEYRKIWLTEFRMAL